MFKHKPAPKLTWRTLAALAPGAALPDPACDGLRYLRAQNGRLYAQLRYRTPDGWHAVGLGPVDIEQLTFEEGLARAHASGDYDEAGRPNASFVGPVGAVLEPIRRTAREKRAALSRGEDPRAPDSFAAVAKRWLREEPGKPKSCIERTRYLTVDWAPFGPRPLSSITKGDVAKRLRELRVGRGRPVAANRARATLSALFRWATKHDYFTGENPVSGTYVAKEESRERVLSLDELRLLWGATDGSSLPHDYCAILRLCMLTAQRRGEVGDLRWDELDLDAGTWTLPGERVKNGHGHTVPLSAPAVALLRALPRHGPYVFGGAGERKARGYRNWSQSKARLDAVLPLRPWTVHDIRRSVATHMAEAGGEPHVIDSLLNHVSAQSRIARTYNRAPYAAQKAALVERWAGQMLGASA